MLSINGDGMERMFGGGGGGGGVLASYRKQGCAALMGQLSKHTHKKMGYNFTVKIPKYGPLIFPHQYPL